MQSRPRRGQAQPTLAHSATTPWRREDYGGERRETILLIVLTKSLSGITKQKTVNSTELISAEFTV